jgi:hypothetical protein
MAQETMPHPGHEKHLCSLVEKGSLKSGMSDYVKLVKGGQYVCAGCGRVAVSAESLCAPQKV